MMSKRFLMRLSRSRYIFLEVVTLRLLCSLFLLLLANMLVEISQARFQFSVST